MAKKSKIITAREIAAFNENVRRMTDAERDAVLERIAYRNAVDAKCDPARVAAFAKWLAKQVRGKRVPRARIEADAAIVFVNGIRAKRCVAFGRAPDRFFDAAADVLRSYGADVVRQADPLGLTMGVTFGKVPYAGGMLFGWNQRLTTFSIV